MSIISTLLCLKQVVDLNDRNPFSLIGKTLLFHSKIIEFKSHNG